MGGETPTRNNVVLKLFLAQSSLIVVVLGWLLLQNNRIAAIESNRFTREQGVTLSERLTTLEAFKAETNRRMNSQESRMVPPEEVLRRLDRLETGLQRLTDYVTEFMRGSNSPQGERPRK